LTGELVVTKLDIRQEQLNGTIKDVGDRASEDVILEEYDLQHWQLCDGGRCCAGE